MTATADPDDRIARVRATWALVATDPKRTARTFYGNLFRLDPTTSPLFTHDMDAQGRKLTDTLGFVIDHLDQPEALLPAAEDLARRHRAYGVSAAQYDSVGAALIETFRQMLGSRFTAEDAAAWNTTYAGLADTMIAAAYDH
jgi:hemoglobin-like flavoprotein